MSFSPPTVAPGPRPAAGPAPDLPRYRVRGLLARGGMGTVWRAHDEALDRPVALKVLDRALAPTEAERARLLAEARIAAGLEHPGIVPVYDVGTLADGAVFFAMRLVEGPLLREALRASRAGDPAWPMRRLLMVFVRVCDAVAYAHAREVVHRDLKPENVIVGPFGEVVVLDWGIARGAGDGPERAGTPGYTAPEQWEEGVASPLADVWSLGAILAEILGTTSPTDVDPLAAVARAAMDEDPARRPEGALALGRAVQAALDGESRREEAARHVERARERWSAFERASEALERRTGELRAEEARVPAWAPLAEKAVLLALRRELGALDAARERCFSETLTAAETALHHHPGDVDARAVLARAWWTRMVDAEARDDARDAAFCRERVLAVDDPEWTGRLVAAARLELDTEPSGAEVVARPWDGDGPRWTLGPPRRLGTTPLVTSLAPGSWLLTLDHPAHPPTRYPVRLPPRGTWSAQGVRLTPCGLPPDAVYVPGGPAELGGDPGAGLQLPAGEREVPGFLVTRFPVTAREYAEFLDALYARDPAEARRRVPRRDEGLGGAGSPWWVETAGGWRIPEVDSDGDRWSPDLPVFGVSWDDARAFASWRAVRDGVAWRLPWEAEWEKAARGVDGRVFPWGDQFDASLCWMSESAPGRAQPVPVGTQAGDESPYGVRDLAGTIREWCGEEHFDGDPGRRPIRGGTWGASARLCRAAHRYGYEPGRTDVQVGFRLAADLPPASRGPITVR